MTAGSAGAGADRPTALVLRALYLGDLITGLPALTMLRRALPDTEIVLAAPVQTGQLAIVAGVVDRVTPALELQPLLQAPRVAAVAVDLHGNGPESRALLASTGPIWLVAFDGRSHLWRQAEHEVDRWCRLIAEAFTVAGPYPALSGLLPVPAGHQLPVGCTIIHPGAKAGARRWPAQRYAQVARELAATGARVLVTGGPGEEQLAAQVAAAAGVEHRSDLSLSELLALVAQAGAVICGDTGIAHVASVYGVSSVVLFGPVSPANWGPPDDPRHQVLWHGDGTGDPHGDRPDPALLQITVAEVLAATARATNARTNRLLGV